MDVLQAIERLVVAAAALIALVLALRHEFQRRQKLRIYIGAYTIDHDSDEIEFEMRVANVCDYLVSIQGCSLHLVKAGELSWRERLLRKLLPRRFRREESNILEVLRHRGSGAGYVAIEPGHMARFGIEPNELESCLRAYRTDRRAKVTLVGVCVDHAGTRHEGLPFRW